MFKIRDGREHFYQWDLNRQLIVESADIEEVHFCNRTDNCALVCKTKVEDGVTVVDVPNIILQSDWRVRVYAWDDNATRYDKYFDVKTRSKPADYIYTETEVYEAEKLVAEMVDAATEDLKEELTYYIDNQIGIALEGEY